MSRPEAGKARDYIGRNLHQQAAMGIPEPTLPGEFPLTSAVPLIVLDTNVVLDWLVFGDRFAAPLGRAIGERRVQWVATASMREEFVQVLAKPELVRNAGLNPAPLTVWDALALQWPAPTECATRCRDATDQMFIDLALAARARWLVTRDRALLDLAKQASIAGTYILRPREWIA